MPSRHPQSRLTGSIRTSTVSPAENVTRPSMPNTTPQKAAPTSAPRNGAPGQRLKDYNTNAISKSNKSASAVHPAPEGNPSRAEALTPTHQSLAHAATSPSLDKPVADSRRGTVSKSSGRHNKQYARSRKGEKQDTLSPPLVQVQETMHNPKAVVLCPINAPLPRKTDEEPRVIQSTKKPGKATRTAVQPVKVLSPSSPPNATAPKPRDTTVISDLANVQPPAQAKTKESANDQGPLAPSMTVALDAAQPGKRSVRVKREKCEAKTQPVPPQPVTPELPKPSETKRRPKKSPSTNSPKSPDPPSIDCSTAVGPSPIETTTTTCTSPLASLPQRSPKTREVALPPAQPSETSRITKQCPKRPIKSPSTKSLDPPSTDYSTAVGPSPIETTATTGTSTLASLPQRLNTREVALPPAQVRFTDGMQIHCITTHHESTRIAIKGWPSDLTADNIKWYLQSYGKIHFVTVTKNDSGEKIAHVRFSQHQEAVAALREIEEGRIELGPWPNRITAAFDTSIAPTLKGTNIVSDTVVLSWVVPKPKLKVFYYTSEKARKWATKISGWTRFGRQLVAKVRRSTDGGMPSRVVVVENLPENTNIARFGCHIQADDRPSWLLNHYDHGTVISEVRKVIDSFARDVSFDQNGDRVTFRCIFRNSEDVIAFMALASKQEWPWRAPARFQMTQHVDVLYILPLAHFAAVKVQLDDLRTQLEVMRVSMKVTRPPGADNVRHILISGSLGLRDGKRLIDRLLAGEVVKHGGTVLWDEDVNSFYGSSILADIHVPGTYISLSHRNQSYTVHGSFDQREEVAKLLIDRVRRAKSHLVVHEFPRNQLRWWARTGLPLIKRKVGRANSWLDPLHCRITVRGDGPARDIVHHCTNKARESWHPPPRPVNGGTLFCPACFEEASDPVRIGCKHVYCRACFTAFLASTARHGGPLPIKCFGDDGKCPQLVSMWDVCKFMQQADVQRLATKVLEVYISRRQDELRYCPTPDCAYIYRVQERITEPLDPEIPKGSKSKQPKGNSKRVDTAPGAPNPKADIPSATIQCPGCLVKICAGCHSAAHERRTCGSVQVEKEKNDKLFQEWLKTSRAKNCPKCSIPLLKDGGCNHVRCGACRTHICWVCMKAFKDEGERESVYEHIRRKHGGSVFGDTHVVAWEARPEDIDESTLLAALAALGVDEDLPRTAPAPAVPRSDTWEYPPPPPPPAEKPKEEPLLAHVVHAIHRPNRRRGGIKGGRHLRDRGDPTWNPHHWVEYEYPEDESDDPIVWPKPWNTYEQEIPDWWEEYDDYDPEWL